MNKQNELRIKMSNPVEIIKVKDFFTERIEEEEQKVYLIFDIKKADYLLSIDEVEKSIRLFAKAKFNLLDHIIEFNKPKEEVIATITKQTLTAIIQMRKKLRAEMLTITAINTQRQKGRINSDLN